jgi:hypothetical protein
MPLSEETSGLSVGTRIASKDVFAEGRSAKAEQTRQKIGASLAALLTGGRRACAGSALAGAAAGVGGGLLLIGSPGNMAPLAVIPVLGLLGAGAGAAGGLGVGAGLAAAESSSRLRNPGGLTLGAAVGGAAVGLVVQWLTRWSLAALVGLDVPVGGAVEGLVIGAAAGIGYALARPAPAARSRTVGAAVVAACCAAGALALAAAGRPLVGGTLHLMAREASGSQVSLTTLGRLVGDPEFGPTSQALISAWEGAIFGWGVGAALFRRRYHGDLTHRSSAAQDSPEG